MKTREFNIKVPIYVEMGKVKVRKMYLNLNLLRNRVAHINNNIKKEFKRVITPSLPIGVEYYEYYRLEYRLFLPNKLKRDVSNVCSIIDKNFGDSIVELGIVPEDNYHHLQDIHYKFGGYDVKGLGYCIVTVVEVHKDDMVPT